MKHKLAENIDKYLEQCNTILPDNAVSINELKDAFFPFR